MADRVTYPAALSRVADDVTLEWVGVFTPATIDRFVRESYDALVRRGAGSPYLAVLTERFVRERLKARAQVQGDVPKLVPEVLFVCVSNAGQLAEVWVIRGDIDRRVRDLLAELVPGQTPFVEEQVSDGG